MPVLVQCDDFALKDCCLFQARQRLHNRWESLLGYPRCAAFWKYLFKKGALQFCVSVYTEEMKRITLDMPDDLHFKLKLQCVTEGIHMAELLRRLAADYLAKADKKIEGKKGKS